MSKKKSLAVRIARKIGHLLEFVTCSAAVLAVATFVGVLPALLVTAGMIWFVAINDGMPVTPSEFRVATKHTREVLNHGWINTKETVRWAVWDWSASHPPQSRRLFHGVLTTEEALDFALRSPEGVALDADLDRKVPTEVQRDAAVAAWLVARGEGHRVPDVDGELA